MKQIKTLQLKQKSIHLNLKTLSHLKPRKQSPQRESLNLDRNLNKARTS